jgi:hypothetical protein
MTALAEPFVPLAGATSRRAGSGCNVQFLYSRPVKMTTRKAGSKRQLTCAGEDSISVTPPEIIFLPHDLNPVKLRDFSSIPGSPCQAEAAR